MTCYELYNLETDHLVTLVVHSPVSTSRLLAMIIEEMGITETVSLQTVVDPDFDYVLEHAATLTPVLFVAVSGDEGLPPPEPAPIHFRLARTGRRYHLDAVDRRDRQRPIPVLPGCSGVHDLVCRNFTEGYRAARAMQIEFAVRHEVVSLGLERQAPGHRMEVA